MILFLMRNYVKKLFRSKSRTALTLSGLILAIVIFVGVLVITETAFDMAMSSVNIYKNCNGVVVKGCLGYEDYKKIANCDMYDTGLEIVENASVRMKELKDSKGRDIVIYGRCVQINSKINLNIVSADVNTNERYSAKLLYGRMVEQSDIDNRNKVMIIDESLARILFGRSDAVGENVTIRVNSLDGKIIIDNYSIIGILEASTQSKIKLENILEALDSKTNEYVESDFIYYIPYTAAYNCYNSENAYMNIVCESKETDYKLIKDYIRTLNLSKSYSIIDADIIYEELAAKIESSRTTMMYAMLCVFIISGLSIMNTMMFAVKERINEIGIRKAIGAFNSDIVIQFVFEGFLYGCISGIIGIVVSLWTISVGFIFLKDKFLGFSRIVFSMETLVLAITLSIVVGIIASLVPAIYASRIKISDALKFD